MQNFFKGKAATAIILVATFILAGVAIFTAVRLYQLRQTSVAPNVPSSIPHAQEIATPTPSSVCSLSFTLTIATPSPTATPSGSPTATPSGSPTASPTGSPTATPTGTPGPTGTPNSCNGTCGSNFNCASNLVCYNGFCRNPSCTSKADCNCSGTSTAAPTTSTATPGPAASLPSSGTDWPTIVGAWFGAVVILGSLLLAI